METSQEAHDFSKEADYVSELEYEVNMLTTFINNSEAGMYVTDYHTGEILYANRKMVSFGNYEYSVEELIGKTCWELMNYIGEGRCSFCPYKRLIDKAGKPLEPYMWEHFFSAHGFWLKIISQAIIWVDGRLAQMTTFYDITETKRMQEELAALVREKEYQRMQQNLQNVLDLLPIPVRIIELENNAILYCNKAAAELFDMMSMEDAVGKSAFAYMPKMQSNGTSTVEKAKSLDGDKPASAEFVCRKPNGERLDLMVTACVIDYNGKKASLGIMKDLTAEKEYQRMLQNTAEKEKEANKLKSNFLSNMSHEIRTPMNAIIGLTEIELHKDLPKEAVEVYRKINMSAKNLLEIVNDILDLSKIEADKLELYPDTFELEDVVNNALLLVSPRLKDKSVKLESNLSKDLPRFIIGDRIRLWQILKNYLDNAVKYTKEGGITLTVDEDKTQSTAETIFVSFIIEDTGIGMDENQLEKVLLPYEQAYNEAQRRYVGTGLGLPISKRLCELMGGILEIESKPGKGTTVRFTIPFARALVGDKGDVPIEQVRAYVKFKDVRVLVCEDNEINQEVASGMLEILGITSVIAGNGSQGVGILKESEPFDLILMDLHMPVMDGYEATRIIRSNHKYDDIPIICLTADAMTEIEDKCRAVGMNGYLSKPIEMDVLQNVLRKWLPEYVISPS